MYWETIEKQGYTNQGQLFGDWIGREDKGGQAWITYHLSGNEWIQVGVRNQKATKNFIPGSTTQTFSGPSLPAYYSLPDPRRHHAERHQLPGGQAHRQGLRDQRQLRLRALEGSHLPSRPADRDHHHHPAHLVPGAQGQLLVRMVQLRVKSLSGN